MHKKHENEGRTHRKGFAFTISDYCSVWNDGFSPYMQIARSLGVDRDYNHPNIEALINFDVELGHHSVLEKILNDIKNGARYAAGDRTTIRGYPLNEEYTVEFRESHDEFGYCLRAVVLGIAEEYQSLPTDKAYDYLKKQESLWDPFADL